MPDERARDEHEYREHAPPAPCRAEIEALWSRSLSAPGREHLVLPDGCVDVLFDLSGARRSPGFVVGAMTRAQRVPAAAHARLVAVRFAPGGAAGWLGLPLAELTDREVDLVELWPDAPAIEERLAAARDPVRELARVLVERLPRRRAPDRWLQAVLRALREDLSARSVEAIAREFGTTRQHLARRFRSEVGVGPKMLGRVLRMQRALRSLSAGPRVALVDLAAACGYADQAHLTRELSALTERTPGAWRRECSESTSPARAPAVPWGA